MPLVTSLNRRSQIGVTLIELVISIVVLSVVVVGVFSALGTMVGRSADPMIREQSVAIAKSYLEEIQLMNFGVPGSCPAVPGGGGRINYSNVCHYNGLNDAGAIDQNGNPIAGLNLYSVSVSVSASGNLGGIASANAARIDVTVTGPTTEPVVMTGYRTNY